MENVFAENDADKGKSERLVHPIASANDKSAVIAERQGDILGEPIIPAIDESAIIEPPRRLIASTT